MLKGINDIWLLKQYFQAVEEFSIVSKTDKAWIITYVNDRFCKISWYTTKELIWKPHNIVRHPDMPKSFYKDLWYTISIKKQLFTGVVKNLKKNWDAYWVKTLIKPILDENNVIKEYISIRQDITKEEEQWEEIEKNKDKSIQELKQLNEIKNDFMNVALMNLELP